jgi:hypothetical protein
MPCGASFAALYSFPIASSYFILPTCYSQQFVGRNKSNKTNRGAQFFRNSVPISDFYRHLLRLALA